MCQRAHNDQEPTARKMSLESLQKLGSHMGKHGPLQFCNIFMPGLKHRSLQKARSKTNKQNAALLCHVGFQQNHEQDGTFVPSLPARQGVGF